MAVEHWVRRYHFTVTKDAPYPQKRAEGTGRGQMMSGEARGNLKPTHYRIVTSLALDCDGC